MVCKVRVKFLLLEEGEFLYNPSTNDLYSCKSPHKKVGVLKIDNDKMSVVLKPAIPVRKP